MKAKELEKNLNNIKSVYKIVGQDRYLCFSVLDLLKKYLCPNFPDLNIVDLSGENLNLDKLIDDLQVCPFADNYRLIIVKDFKIKKNAGKTVIEQIEKIDDYAKQKNFTTVLVFFCADNDGVNLKNAEIIDCSHLSEFELIKFIDEKLKQVNAKMEDSSKNSLIKFTSCDLTRIVTELDKLIAFAGGETITQTNVDEMVAKDGEYQIFELAETIAKNDKTRAIELLNLMLDKEKTLFSIITPLYNTYKRALFIAINKELTDKELANYLQIKEYAVKMLRTQTRVFTPRKLKSIVDSLAELDKNIKQGKIKEDVGLISVVINILMLRK